MQQYKVALPTEGVDRNFHGISHGIPPKVALPTEGVDRNTKMPPPGTRKVRRPPHGGRG